MTLAGRAVAVLGYEFWHETLNADSSIIGKTIHLDSRPMTVVAVAPKGFKGVIGAVETESGPVPLELVAATVNE